MVVLGRESKDFEKLCEHFGKKAALEISTDAAISENGLYIDQLDPQKGAVKFKAKGGDYTPLNWSNFEFWKTVVIYGNPKTGIMSIVLKFKEKKNKNKKS